MDEVYELQWMNATYINWLKSNGEELLLLLLLFYFIDFVFIFISHYLRLFVMFNVICVYNGMGL